MITDNNILALALVLVLPLIEYCRHVTENVWIRYACICGLFFTTVAILGSLLEGRSHCARGMLLALFVWKAKRRLLFAIVFAIPVVLALIVFPQEWSERMATIETAESDQSFQTRLESWKTALRIGLDRPWVGVGYRAIENQVDLCLLQS